MTSVPRPDLGRPFDTAPAFPAPAASPVTSPWVRDGGAPAEEAPAQPSVARTAARVAWAVPAMLGVLGLTAIVYLWDLTISGYANTYYAMAAQAGSQSWSAWLFGSLDAGNFITLDKPPFATMVMGLSIRLFGLSSWSILLPQALAGVATVGLLMLTVRRGLGASAAVIAGFVAALTPAAVLIFRFDNPDALLTLLLVGAAYALTRALASGAHRWVALAGVLIGFAFLTKYLQAYLVLPAFGLVYALAAVGSIRRRIAGLAIAALSVAIASGWWVALMELLPASARPYIGGSGTNSVVALLLGYDGLGRIFGGGGPGGGGGGPGAGFSGVPGILRLFNAEFGGQIAWLLPLAFAGLGIGLWARRHAPRTDAARAAYLLWGGWLLVHVVVFSFMSGIIHTYYVVAMAPAIGALVGGGLVELWRARERFEAAGFLLGAAIAGSAVVAWLLMQRTPDFAPGLGIAILLGGVIVAAALALPRRVISSRVALVPAIAGLALLLAAPAAYAIDTMHTAYSGGDPSAGPRSAGAGFGQGGPGGGGPGFVRPNGFNGGSGQGVFPGLGDGFGQGRGGGLAGGPGGSGGSVDASVVDYLVDAHTTETWLVAVSGSGEAANLQLATGIPVMAMGGFSGGDDALTVEQLKAYVANGQLRYVLLGGEDGGFRGSASIDRWVTTHGTQVTSAGGGTLYDLAGALKES